jgi:hypothetical protein
VDMSGAYLAETVASMVQHGFHCDTALELDAPDGAGAFARTTYRLSRGTEVLFVVECCRYPDGDEGYYLEIARYHGLTSFSYPLDSWRHHADRVEFKLLADPDTAQGLALVLRFDQ